MTESIYGVLLIVSLACAWLGGYWIAKQKYDTGTVRYPKSSKYDFAPYTRRNCRPGPDDFRPPPPPSPPKKEK